MKISDKLEQLKNKGEGALAMFATAGDPDDKKALEIFKAMGRGGADILEIGIPYSDPLMDGPVLQASYQRALGAGFKLKTFPGFIEKVCNTTGVGALIMTCYNPVYKYGVMRFFRDVKNAGADAVLLTDLPPEEWGDSMEMARQFDLGAIFLATPSTTPERLEQIAELSNPFLYCVSMMGVTGSKIVPDELKKYMDRVRAAVQSPLLVGFGISTPEEAKMVGGISDGIVVGSALVKLVEQNLGNDEKMYEAVETFTRSLKQALV